MFNKLSVHQIVNTFYSMGREYELRERLKDNSGLKVMWEMP